MLRIRVRRLLTILTTALVALVGTASAASALVPEPDPVRESPSLYVDLTSTADGGMAWWGIALIALAAACVAGIVTEFVDTVRNRHHSTSFGHA